MEFRGGFCGENQFQEQIHEQFQPQLGICWCKGTNNIREVIHGLMPEIKPTIREEVEEALKKFLLPYLSLLQSSVIPPTSSSLPHTAESSASRRLRLQFKSNIPDNFLYTLIKIEEQSTLFDVELLDESGRRVEFDLESPVKIKIDVLNGDFNVEENVGWTQEDYNKNIVKTRKYKAELLMGKCKMTLSRGVVSLGDLCFTDNSSHVTNKTFRLGATVEGLIPGMVIEAAVSQEFRVKERRTKDQGKLKEPSAEDALCCLVGIAKKGAVYNRACEAGIFTVKDFLQRLNTNAKELKNILNVRERNWNEIVKNAKACKLPEVDNERPSALAFDQELTYRPFIQSEQELEQPSQPPRPPSLPRNGSGYFSVGGFGHSSNEECLISSQTCNISHPNIDQYFGAIPPTSAGQGQMCGSSTHENSELLISSTPDMEQWLQEFMLNNSPPREERGRVPEDSSHDHITSKLLAVCYVTKAATLFMVSAKQDISAPKKKRKLQ